MARSKGYASFIGKIGIGFDPVLDLLTSVDANTTIENVTSIPPYNIKKTSDGGYTLEIALTGVDKADVTATLDADYLTIAATVKDGFTPDGDSDDVYFHQGILAGGQISAKFLVAHNLKFKDADLDDGILTVNFSDTNEARDTETLAIGPFPKENVHYDVVYNSAGSPTYVPVGEDPNSSPDAVPVAPAPVADTPAPVDTPVDTAPAVVDPAPVADPTVPVTVNSDTPATATVTVDTPAVVPAVVEATVSDVSPVVLPDSSASQAKVTITDATNGATPDAVPIATIPTPEGSPDIVVKATPAATAAAASAGIDIPSVVSAALDHPDVSVTTDTPAPTVDVVANSGEATTATANVQLPADLPQVVTAEATAVKPVVDQQSETPQATVVVSDATHEIVSDNVVTDVAKTPDGKADVVVAVDADHQAEMKAQGVDVLASAVNAIEQAPAGVNLPNPPPTSTPETADAQPADVKVQPATPDAAPVTVSVPAVVPSVVTATADPATATVTLTPSADVPPDATLTPVVTADNQHDIVVATTPDTDKALSTMGVDVSKDVSTAVVAAQTPVVTSSDATVTVDAPAAPEAQPSDPAPVASDDAAASTQPATPEAPVEAQTAPVDATPPVQIDATPVAEPQPDASPVAPTTPVDAAPDTPPVSAPETPAPTDESAPSTDAVAPAAPPVVDTPVQPVADASAETPSTPVVSETASPSTTDAAPAPADAAPVVDTAPEAPATTPAPTDAPVDPAPAAAPEADPAPAADASTPPAAPTSDPTAPVNVVANTSGGLE